jgi:cytochrome P450
MATAADLKVTTKVLITRTVLRRFARGGDLVSELILHRHLDDPYPVYERIRAGGPLYRSRLGLRAVTAHGLCSQVLRDPAFVLSNRTEEVRDGGRKRKVTARGGRRGGDRGFLDVEVADHARLRRLVAPAFRAKVMKTWEERVEKLAHRLLDDALARDSFDLVGDYAAALPIIVISELLGLTDVDVPTFARYGLVTARAIDGMRSAEQAREYAVAMRDLDAIFDNLIERRRADPRDDLVSFLVTSPEGAFLTSRELAATCQLLLTAGFETTTNMVGNAVAQFLRDPQQWQLLRDDPGLSARAVEEVLRFDPPIQYSVRAASGEMDLAGERLAPGSVLLLLLAAANRDPEVYSSPERFDITRSGRSEHLAFLDGPHYCIGAPLARMEGDVALRVLAQRVSRLEVAGPVTRRPTAAFRGLLELPLRAAG